ncbi:hypothetical protein MACH26_31820 [Planctobacterium marinum]|uniref:Polysaccharide biosynthesis protein C-terminal domain-containing protein n=1 Tax=Planctobacterium marinum TaxID=1631968 RepID=A0AA48HMS0_9ALTE|nr:hypothetical protein MACH26_31820 [Planctobacterium marinum]
MFWTGIVASIVTFFLMGGRKFFGISEVTFASVKNALSDPIVRGFFIIELVTVSFMKVDVLLLRYFDTNYQHLAEYFFSVQVFEAAILMLMPVTFLFFNRFNQKRDSQSGQSLLKKSALILSIVFSLGLMTWCFLGNFILSNLFPGYSNAFETILILTIALLPNAFNALFSAYLIANHKENIFIWVSVLGLLLLFCINLFAIPAFSIRGAAWARLISEFGIAVILLTYVIAMLRRSKNNY